ncbi:MAG: hypothetical protein JO033_14030 [Acidobacteriaceae bacterium]|nr:hypothetical protein [Acidobacteriaceae bacterium]MBV9501106.1 hypothetical protein [Acidobacteriaceae bacterium]
MKTSEGARVLDRRRVQIAVIGDGEGEGEILRAAEELGARIARAGAVLVTGGHGGVMEAAAKGAVQNGGTAVGILRSGDLSTANPYCTIVIGTDIGHARNVLIVLSSDAVIPLEAAPAPYPRYASPGSIRDRFWFFEGLVDGAIVPTHYLWIPGV